MHHFFHFPHRANATKCRVPCAHQVADEEHTIRMHCRRENTRNTSVDHPVILKGGIRVTRRRRKEKIMARVAMHLFECECFMKVASPENSWNTLLPFAEEEEEEEEEDFLESVLCVSVGFDFVRENCTLYSGQYNALFK